MQNDFSSLLTAHLSHLRERVLADHSREVQRLTESLQTKAGKQADMGGSGIEDGTSRPMTGQTDADGASRMTIGISTNAAASPLREIMTASNPYPDDLSCMSPLVKDVGPTSPKLILKDHPRVHFIQPSSDDSEEDSDPDDCTDASVGTYTCPGSPRTPIAVRDADASLSFFINDPKKNEPAVNSDFVLASAWTKHGNKSIRASKESLTRRGAGNSKLRQYIGPVMKSETTDGIETTASTGSLYSDWKFKRSSMRSNSSLDFPFRQPSENDMTSHWIGNFMVPPSSMKQICWNLAGLAIIIYDLVTVSLEVFNPAQTAFSVTMLVLTSLFWTFDLAGNFFTGYLSKDGTVHMNPKSVARRYALTWFPLDACLIICNWAALSGVQDSDKSGFEGLDPWRTFTLLRAFRILRLLKAPEMEGFITEHIRSETKRLVASIARLIVLLLLVAHLIACAWYGLGRLVADRGNNASWVTRYELEQKGIGHKYTHSMHWSLSQFTGENIIPIETEAERTFAIVIFVFAFLFSTIFVSSITTLMTRLQIIAGKQSSQLSTLRRYLADSSISTSLTVRVLRNARLALNQNQRNLSEHSVELLQEISEPLQIELHFEVHFPTLSCHPFFKDYNKVNPAGLRKLCHHAVSITSMSPNDVVFSECETPERASMFFVVKGVLVYTQDGVADATKLHPGDWACEIVLWSSIVQHMGNLHAETESSLMSLDAEKFQRIVRHFPTSHARNYASSFVAHLNKMNKDAITDVPVLDVGPLCDETFEELRASASLQVASFRRTRPSLTDVIGRKLSERSQIPASPASTNPRSPDSGRMLVTRSKSEPGRRPISR